MMRISFSYLRTGLSAFTVLVCAFALLPTADAQDLKNLFNPGGKGLGGGLSVGSESKVEVRLISADPKPGGEATLAITVTLPSDGYTYSTSPKFGGGTKIRVNKTDGLEPLGEGFVADHPPKVVFEPLFDQEIEKYHTKVTWARKYRISADADIEKVSIAGILDYQVCDASSCRPLKHEFAVNLKKGEEPSFLISESATVKPYRYEEIPQRRGKPEPLTLKFELSPENAKPGDEVTLSVSAVLEDKWHIFALTQDPEMAGQPTKILVTPNGLKPTDGSFSPNQKPETEKPLEDIVQKVHYEQVTWSRRFTVESSEYGVSGKIRFQVCNEGSCRPPMSVAFALGQVGDGSQQQSNFVEAEENSGELTGNTNAPKHGLVPFLIAAVTSGFLALLTPCVFPMIPITVSFFLKQSEKEHHKPIYTASIYCIGIMVTFTVLGLLMAAFFGATSVNQLANNPWLNIVIAGVLIFFGMNLLGLFEIRIPSWLLTWSAVKESTGGIIGVLFMSLTFTLTSFTCTFAFAGLLLVWAANGEYYWPIVGLLAFSGAFSLPFFFLALFPSYLQKLPKSGGWMNTVKVTMGLVECGAAFKFLSVADLAWNPVPMLFDYATVMSAWMVISICAGLYLLDLFRLPHDTPTESISVPRFAVAMTFLGLAAYLAVGLFAYEKPTGKLWEQIAAFAPPKFEGGDDEMGPFLEHDGLKYALDFDRALEYASAKNLPLFLDFTGVNCVNCRLMEKRMELPHNRELLENFVRVQLYTDNVPSIKNRKLVEELLEKNRDLQQNWFGDVTLPSYAVVTPDGRIRLAVFKGLEQTDGDFAKFLDSGLKKWQQIAGNSVETNAVLR